MKKMYPPLHLVLFLIPMIAMNAKALEQSNEGAGHLDRLSPQLLLQKLLSSSSAVERIKLAMAGAQLSQEAALVPLDAQFSTQGQYQNNRAEPLTLFGPQQEVTQTLRSSISKLLSSGTSLSVYYRHLTYEPTFPPAPFEFGFGRVFQETAGVSVQQDLWRNSFGSSIRKQLEASKHTFKAAQLQGQDELESLSQQVLGIYWQMLATYFAKDKLQQSQKRIEELLKYAKQRSNYGIDELGEIPRIQADLLSQQQRVIGQSTLIQQMMTRLSVLLNFKLPDQLDQYIQPITEVGPRPEAHSDSQKHRRQSIIEERIRSAQLDLQAAQSESNPRLAVFATGEVIGVDVDRSEAVSKMQSGRRPNVILGLSFDMPIGNVAAEIKQAEKRLQLSQAELDLRTTEDEIKSQKQSLLLEAQAAWDLSLSADEIVKLRMQAVETLQNGYRQGRIGLDQVILASNNLLLSEIEAISQRSSFFAARDQLLLFEQRLIAHYLGQQLWTEISSQMGVNP